MLPDRTFLMRFGAVLLALATACVLLWLPPPPSMSMLDEMARDVLLRAQASPEEETRVVVVDIDESSLRDVGSWPWPRERIADLAEILIVDYAARAVALDMVFPEAADALGDGRLASLTAHGPLTLSIALDFAERHTRLALGALPDAPAGLRNAPAVAAAGYIANHSGLARARCVGNIGFKPDRDGTLRHLPVAASVQGQTFPTLAAALLTCPPPAAVDAATAAALQLAERGAGANRRVPYRRALEAYTVIPAAAILERSAPPELLAGRWVLIGSSALGLADRVSTPFSPSTPGVLVHAQVASALLDGAPEFWSGTVLAVGWTLFSLALLFAVLPRIPVLAGLGLLLALAVAWLAVAWQATALGGIVPLTPPLFAYLVFLILAVPYEWWLSQRESRRVLDIFSHYLAPTVIRELMRARLDKPLEPALKDVTVLIADMEGYTAITSTLRLEEAAELTQGFLDCLTRPVLANAGTLDKYTGDGLVAFWGAPLPSPNQADQAIAASLEILRNVQELNARRRAAGQAAVRVRIGIESGTALVGDLGTAFRSAYTAVGDCINFASKLQEAARDLPVQIVVGPHTRAGAEAHRLLALGSVPVRGVGQPIELFTPAAAVAEPRHGPDAARVSP